MAVLLNKDPGSNRPKVFFSTLRRISGTEELAAERATVGPRGGSSARVGSARKIVIGRIERRGSLSRLS